MQHQSVHNALENKKSSNNRNKLVTVNRLIQLSMFDKNWWMMMRKFWTKDKILMIGIRWSEGGMHDWRQSSWWRYHIGEEDYSHMLVNKEILEIKSEIHWVEEIVIKPFSVIKILTQLPKLDPLCSIKRTVKNDLHNRNCERSFIYMINQM